MRSSSDLFRLNLALGPCSFGSSGCVRACSGPATVDERSARDSRCSTYGDSRRFWSRFGCVVLIHGSVHGLRARQASTPPPAKSAVLRARIVVSLSTRTDPSPAGVRQWQRLPHGAIPGQRLTSVMSPIARALAARCSFPGRVRHHAELITKRKGYARQPLARALNADSNPCTASSTSSKSGTSPNNIDSRMAS